MQTDKASNQSLQPFEGFGKPGEVRWLRSSTINSREKPIARTGVPFARGKGFACCETETAGVVESTVPPVGVGSWRSQRCREMVALNVSFASRSVIADADHVVDPAWLSFCR